MKRVLMESLLQEVRSAVQAGELLRRLSAKGGREISDPETWGKLIKLRRAVTTPKGRYSKHMPAHEFHDRSTVKHMRDVGKFGWRGFKQGNVPEHVAQAAYAHDVGKVRALVDSKGEKMFKHEQLGADIMDRMKVPKKVTELVRQHGVQMNAEQAKPESIKKSMANSASVTGQTPHEFTRDLTQLSKLDKAGFSKIGQKKGFEQVNLYRDKFNQ